MSSGSGIEFFFYLHNVCSYFAFAIARPSELSTDGKLITRRRLCVAASLVFISWVTCGALAILITYLHYTFKVFTYQSKVLKLSNYGFFESVV